jgi:hypothetical protein
MRKQAFAILRKRVFQTNQIQGLYGPSEAILYFWDLKLKVVLAKFSRSQIEEMANEVS